MIFPDQQHWFKNPVPADRDPYVDRAAVRGALREAGKACGAGGLHHAPAHHVPRHPPGTTVYYIAVVYNKF